MRILTGPCLLLVPLHPVCSDCQKVAPFLHFFLQLTDKSFAQRFRNILTCARRQSATIPKHLDLCVLTDTILMLCNSIRDFCLHVCLFSSTYFYLLLDLRKTFNAVEQRGWTFNETSTDVTLLLISGFAWNISNV